MSKAIASTYWRWQIPTNFQDSFVMVTKNLTIAYQKQPQGKMSYGTNPGQKTLSDVTPTFKAPMKSIPTRENKIVLGMQSKENKTRSKLVKFKPFIRTL